MCVAPEKGRCTWEFARIIDLEFKLLGTWIFIIYGQRVCGIQSNSKTVLALLLNDSTGHKFTAVGSTRADISKQTQVTITFLHTESWSLVAKHRIQQVRTPRFYSWLGMDCRYAPLCLCLFLYSWDNKSHLFDMFMDLQIKSINQVLGTDCQSPELSLPVLQKRWHLCLLRHCKSAYFHTWEINEHFQTQETKIMHTKEPTVIITFLLA